MQLRPAWLVPLLILASSPAAAAGSVGFELEIGLARGPFRYEGATGEGNRATAETNFESLALGVGAHGGFELSADYFVGVRLGAGVLPTLSGGVQSTHFNGALHARAELAAWRAPIDELNFGLAGGIGTLGLAYSVDEAAIPADVHYEDEALYGPVGDIWIAHPFGHGWSVGAVAGFGWLTSEHARFAMFSAALRVSYDPWQSRR
ncbi:MAG TPA: hypothetical protein VM686_18005 [Polyangiaceae bacterium]|nr:hypothetical protein [Polyangiaceae bacterium]